TQTHGIPELIEDVTEAGAKGKTQGALDAAKDKVSEFIGDEDEEKEPARKSSRPRKSSSTSKGRRSSSGSRRSRSSEKG
ncbi:MAG TPA: hypothetical protein VFR22_15175, partial [Nocardioidaceae bacterium]|nr:hypothetical protein [Nocardioidaceae bacterium]